MAHLNLPDLRKSTAQLSADNARIMKFTDGLPSRVDKLVAAALAKDWTEVRRLAEYLMRSSEAYGCPNVSSCAQQMCDELDKPDNNVGIQQGLVRLIGACGTAPDGPPKRQRMRKRQTEKPVS